MGNFAFSPTSPFSSPSVTRFGLSAIGCGKRWMGITIGDEDLRTAVRLVNRIRRALAGLKPIEAISALIEQLKKYPATKDLLAAVNKLQ